MEKNKKISTLFFHLQFFFIFGLFAWVIYHLVRMPAIVFASPFPQPIVEIGGSGILLLFLIAIAYILAAFRTEQYWYRLYMFFLSFTTLYGILYLSFLFSDATPLWIIYGVTIFFLTVFRFSERAFFHTLVQFFSLCGIILFFGTHISILQAILFLILFTLYDMVAAFFPKKLFHAIARLFRIDHSISVVLPLTPSGWFASHHNENTVAIRAIDIALPLLCILLVSYSYDSMLFVLMSVGWMVGLSIAIRTTSALQSRLFYPLVGIALCGVIGFFVIVQ